MPRDVSLQMALHDCVVKIRVPMWCFHIDDIIRVKGFFDRLFVFFFHKSKAMTKVEVYYNVGTSRYYPHELRIFTVRNVLMLFERGLC